MEMERMMDLSKLSPAPWRAIRHEYNSEIEGLGGIQTHDEELVYEPDAAEFVALARNAFDVQMRRGWYAVPDLDKWAVGPASAIPDGLLNLRWADPYTALDEADKWMKANVEGASEP